ncbi:MAG: hypothetical protein IKK21_08725 [Clostridia bacterium]|nr:hypothetical protein [Clostridia bacterium]
MIRRVTAGKLPALADAFWDCAMDLTRSGYPTYTDGVKTRADFDAYLSRACQADWGEVLVYEHGGAVCGLIAVDIVDDAYVSLHVCLCRTHSQEMLAELLRRLSGEHAGKTLWFGFAPENAAYLGFAEEHGFAVLEESVNWIMPMNGTCPPAPGVCAVTADDPAFRRFWRDPDMYWTAERIAANPAGWTLLVHERGAAAMLDSGDTQEIFGFEYADGFDETAFFALMQGCLHIAKVKGAAHMNYFASPEESAVMAALGFRRVSGYLCYERKL